MSRIACIEPAGEVSYDGHSCVERPFAIAVTTAAPQHCVEGTTTDSLAAVHSNSAVTGDGMAGSLGRRPRGSPPARRAAA
jgi:hypothetical protein